LPASTKGNKNTRKRGPQAQSTVSGRDTAANSAGAIIIMGLTPSMLQENPAKRARAYLDHLASTSSSSVSSPPMMLSHKAPVSFQQQSSSSGRCGKAGGSISSMYNLSIEHVPHVLSASQQAFLEEVASTREGLLQLTGSDNNHSAHGISSMASDLSSAKPKFHLRDFCKVPWRYAVRCNVCMCVCVCVSMCIHVYHFLTCLVFSQEHLYKRKGGTHMGGDHRANDAFVCSMEDRFHTDPGVWGVVCKPCKEVDRGFSVKNK